MNFDQLHEYTPELLEIAKKFGISKIQVFGSVARGNPSPQSDIDFLVEMEEGASLFGVAGFMVEAEMLLGVQVDVVPVSVLASVTDRNFVLSIQKEAIPL